MHAVAKMCTGVSCIYDHICPYHDSRHGKIQTTLCVRSMGVLIDVEVANAKKLVLQFDLLGCVPLQRLQQRDLQCSLRLRSPEHSLLALSPC